MKNLLLATLLSTLVSLPALAQTAASTPAAGPMTHFMCKDGTAEERATARGACGGHKGIDKKAMEKMPAEAPSKPLVTGDKAMKATPVAMEQAAGGGDGKVWLNDSTKVYHCQGDRYYGKTKHGEYLTEAEAKAKGAHASHAKACMK